MVFSHDGCQEGGVGGGVHMEKEKEADVFPQYGLGFFLLLVCRVRGAVVIRRVL